MVKLFLFSSFVYCLSFKIILSKITKIVLYAFGFAYLFFTPQQDLARSFAR